MLGNGRTTDALAPWGLTILRVVVGFVFLMHGWQKLFQMGIGGVGGFFGSVGIPLPGAAAAVVTLLELLGGLALILGVGTRIVGVLLALDMLGAMFFVHGAKGFWAADGGVEMVLILGAAALCLALTGPGAVAVDALLGQDRGRARAGAAVPARG